MEETLRLEFVISAKDIEEIQDALLEKKAGRIGKWLWLTFALGGMILALLAMYLRVEPPHRPYAAAFFLTIISVIFAFQWWRGKRTLPAMIVEISPEEVRITSGESGQTIPWSALGSLVETDKFFLLPERKGNLSYVLPKEAFPDEESCDWLRNLSESAASAEPAISHPQEVPPSDDFQSVTLTFRLRYRDYLDRSLASWATRGFIFFVVAIMLGSFIAVALDPPEDAVFSSWQVFMLEIPFMIAMVLMVFVLGATFAWMNHRGSIVDQTVTLSQSELRSTSRSGLVAMNWQTPTFFKETPWSFIVWWPSTGGWMLLPKRACSTVDGANRCREFLETNAKRSTWYFGR